MKHYTEARLLLFDGSEDRVTHFRTVARLAGLKTVVTTPVADIATADLEPVNEADILFVYWELSSNASLNLCRGLRLHPRSPDPFLPIIIMAEGATLQNVQSARDAGVDEFLACPYSAKSLQDRIRAVVTHRRGFVRNGNYFGPDRRRTPDRQTEFGERRREDVELITPHPSTG